MKKSVRVVLDHDGDPDMAMTVDLIVSDGGRIVGGVPFCGWWGRLKGNSVWMFVLLPDGRVDYGSTPETDQKTRFGKINLHDKVAQIGEYVTYFSAENGEETMFKIGRIVDLLD